LTVNLDLDDPNNTLLRRQIIRDKSFLESIYQEWYNIISNKFDSECDTILEVGSGAGFLKDYLPKVLTSEIFPIEGVDLVEDATKLGLEDSSLDGIVMTDVLHHIPNVDEFFAEAQRALRPEGQLIMIEPWNTGWARFIYRNFHHEPFEPDASDWSFPKGGPLSSANGALPWIVFSRDRAKFEMKNPQLNIVSIKPIMPFAYLASGGLATRFGFPRFTYRLIRAFERTVLKERGAMFAVISVNLARPTG
jgi:SAM-dependent methyltransferase